MSVISAIYKAFEHKEKRNWDTIFFAIDIHDTIIKSNYQTGNIPTEFYPNAIVGLQELTLRKDIKLILYTCSHPHEILEYLKLFRKYNIFFDFINENTDVKTNLQGYGNYEQKPYFNVLLDDKAGFNPISDWPKVIQSLNPYRDKNALPILGKENECNEWETIRLI